MICAALVAGCARAPEIKSGKLADRPAEVVEDAVSTADGNLVVLNVPGMV